VDGHEVDRARPRLLTRQLAALTGAFILGVTVTAHADDDPDVDAGKCQVIKFCVGVNVENKTQGDAGQSSAPISGNSKSQMQCKLTKVDPKPPASHPAWHGANPKKADLYFRACTDGSNDNPAGFIVVPQGQPPPQVDPQELARRVVDSMTLLGPDIASPRAAGEYIVGVPMWMWVDQSPTTYGPNSASATAGGVTVTATAKVSKIVWKMGDGSIVSCHGPGEKYSPVYGRQESPSCGHTYAATSASQPSGVYTVTATSTWTVDWQVAGGGGESGRLVESRQSQMQVAIGELQVVR